MPQQLSPIPSFSFTEHKVGKKWVDGKDIYEKTIDFGNLPNYNNKTVEHGITNLDKIISLTGIAVQDDNYIPLPATANSSSWSIELGASDTMISISTQSDRSDYYGYITVYYTKTEEV